MLHIKRLSGTYHAHTVLNFVQRATKNRNKPKNKAYPGDIIKVAQMPKNEDQWEVVAGKVIPDVDEVTADDGSKFKKTRRTKKSKLPIKEDLLNKKEFTEVTTKHDGDVRHFVNNDDGEEFILHPAKDGEDETVEKLVVEDKSEIKMEPVKGKKGYYNVFLIDGDKKKKQNDKPLTKKEALQLIQ